MNAFRALAGFAGFVIVSSSAAADLTRSSDGRELLGGKPPEWGAVEWLAAKPHTLASLRGKVVVVRWWTAPGCPFCSGSAETLNALWEKERDRGLMVMGMYHHKAGSPLTRKHVAEQAKRLGFTFPIAIDKDWKVLRRWWLDGGDRRWTSVTFVIGRDGTIRHIHPGGTLARGEPGYESFQTAVRDALAEASPVGSQGPAALRNAGRANTNALAKVEGISKSPPHESPPISFHFLRGS